MLFEHFNTIAAMLAMLNSFTLYDIANTAYSLSDLVFFVDV
jgi:hypothetical protein